jgi:hypothetical protein
MDYGEVISSLNLFFKEPTNDDIQVIIALRYVKRQKDGAAEGELKALEADMRKTADAFKQ